MIKSVGGRKLQGRKSLSFESAQQGPAATRDNQWECISLNPEGVKVQPVLEKKRMSQTAFEN